MIYTDKTIQKALNALGDKSMVIAMEELAELQQSISKGLRGKLNKDNLSEELADVGIIYDWIMCYFDVSWDEIHKWKDLKQNRIMNRLERGELS